MAGLGPGWCVGWAGAGAGAGSEMGWRRLGWIVKRRGWRKMDRAWKRGRVGFGFREGRLSCTSAVPDFGRHVFLSSSPICPVGYACRPLELAGGGVGSEGAQTGATCNETRDGYDDGRIKSKRHARRCDGTGWRWHARRTLLTKGESGFPASKNRVGGNKRAMRKPLCAPSPCPCLPIRMISYGGRDKPLKYGVSALMILSSRGSSFPTLYAYFIHQV